MYYRQLKRSLLKDLAKTKRTLQANLAKTKRMLKARVQAVERELLSEADLVGATCTGSGGPELKDFSFDLVVMDEGSQCSE